MKIISHYANIMLLLLITYTATAQSGIETRKDDHIKGPVYLYKKTILKNFTEKFGKYEADNTYVKNWYIYDNEGRKIFDQHYSDRFNSNIRRILFVKDDKIRSEAFLRFKEPKNEPIYRFTYYKYPQKNIKEKYSGGDLFVTEKYNAQNLLFERIDRVNETIFGKEEWVYDNNGKIIGYTQYKSDGSVSQKIVYKRDAKGNLLKKTTYDTNGQVSSKEVFEYNDFGKETKWTEYGKHGSVGWSYEIQYLNDTLELKRTDYSSGKPNIIYINEYSPDKTLLLKKKYLLISGKKANVSVVYMYNSKKQLQEETSYKGNKKTRKIIYSDYSGNTYLSENTKVFNTDGSISTVFDERFDKYGNITAYEEYKYENKFGETVKIPVEKQEIEISYYDDTPKFTVNIQVVEEKHKNSKGKKIKEDYLKIDIKNATTKPKIHLYDKPGVTHYGGSKPNLHKYGYNFSFQFNYFKRFYIPYMVVEAGNNVMLVKLPFE